MSSHRGPSSTATSPFSPTPGRDWSLSPPLSAFGPRSHATSCRGDPRLLPLSIEAWLRTARLQKCTTLSLYDSRAVNEDGADIMDSSPSCPGDVYSSWTTVTSRFWASPLKVHDARVRLDVFTCQSRPISSQRYAVSRTLAPSTLSHQARLPQLPPRPIPRLTSSYCAFSTFAVSQSKHARPSRPGSTRNYRPDDLPLSAPFCSCAVVRASPIPMSVFYLSALHRASMCSL